MRGTSQRSRDAVVRAFSPVALAAGKDAATVAQELFSVVDALDGSASLRRALTDPARPGTDKNVLVASLFGSLDARTLGVLSDAVSARWSHEADLAQALDEAGVEALLAAAQSAKVTGRVEEELFRVERELVSNRELLLAVEDHLSSRKARIALVAEVFGNTLHPFTLALVQRKAASPRGERVLTALRELTHAATERDGRLVASVTAAVELSAAQRKRLGTILADAYGREVHINVAIDPVVLGGIKVQVGSDVVDGTVLARLDDARRRLVG